MTDPTPETTPTRDEAVPGGWKLVPVEPTPEMYIKGGSAMMDARHNAETAADEACACYAAMLASAPAPASGRVEAVAVVHRIRATEHYFEAGDRQASERYELTEEQAAALLSPATTPVSEAEPVAVAFPADGELMVMENGHRSNDFERWARGFELPLHMAESGLGRFYKDDRTEWAWHSWSAALAKPASEPAGGDVVQTLIDKTEKLIEAADDMAWSCNSSSADQAIREARDAVRAALSQSTSAGRVGE